MILKHPLSMKDIFNGFNRIVRPQLILLIISFIGVLLSPSCGVFSSKKVENSARYNPKTVSTIVQKARSYTGTPYKYGGTTAAGFDCSGLVTVAFQSVNLALPRTSYDMAETGREVSVKEIEVGDLVFFVTNKNSDRISHVGIVTEVKKEGEIKFIHAADSGVREDNLGSKYYKSTFVKAVRPF
jgi:probable lipoprotein NlpC